MAEMDPYIYAMGAGLGGGIAFIGKWVVNLISGIITKAEERGDRLENKLFETQAVIYPALEAANSAIREAIAQKKEG